MDENTYYHAKSLAEITAEMYRRMDGIKDLTGWEIYETFPDMDNYYRLFISMVDGYFYDSSLNAFSEYVDEEIDYDTLLERVGAGLNDSIY